MSHFKVLVPALLSALLGGACASTGDGGEAPASEPALSSSATEASSPDEADEADEADEEDGAARARKLKKKAHELEMARVDLKLAGMKTESDLVDAREEVGQAERALHEARMAREVYEHDEWPREVASATLAIDRAQGRADDSAAELAELEAMYANEEFALSTKELVIARGRRSLEHALRSLKLQRASAEAEATHAMPKKVRELENGIHRAEVKLEGARGALMRAELSAAQSMAKAEFRVQELEHELSELKEGAEA